MELTVTRFPETAWQSGRFSARPGPSKLLFGQMYEDATVELAAFPSSSRVFCIASGGCTAMRLSPYHDVVAVDLNPVQIAYVRRRLDGQPVECGIADRILAFGRALAPLAGWTRSKLCRFLNLDDPKEQTSYWRRYLDTRRFRASFDLLFSRLPLRLIYSAAFLDCLPQRFGAVLRTRLERCFALYPNRNNPYARLLLLGENCPSDATRCERIDLVCADAATFLEAQSPGSFTGFSLSNILDGTNAAYERRLLNAIKNAAAPGAPVVLRSFAEADPSSQTNQAIQDRSMLWGVVEVRSAESL